MENKTIKQKIFFKKCPICKKEITGTKESQVEYNLKIHMEAKHDFKK